MVYRLSGFPAESFMRSSQLLCTPRVLFFFLEILKKCMSVSKHVSRDSMFGIVTKLQTGGPKNCVFPVKEKIFLSSHSLQTDYGSHPASHWMSTVSVTKG